MDAEGIPVIPKKIIITEHFVIRPKYFTRQRCPYCGNPFYAPNFSGSMANRSGFSNIPRTTARCPGCRGEFPIEVMKEK